MLTHHLRVLYAILECRPYTTYKGNIPFWITRDYIVDHDLKAKLCPLVDLLKQRADRRMLEYFQFEAPDGVTLSPECGRSERRWLRVNAFCSRLSIAFDYPPGNPGDDPPLPWSPFPYASPYASQSR